MANTQNEPELGPNPTIRGALVRLGLTSLGPATLAIVATKETSLSPEQVWETWSKIDQWTRWSKPLHENARWLEGRTWEVGSKFQQIRSFGAPVGKQVTVETVREVNPGQSVSWWGGKGGSMKTCHLWFFEALPDGGTRVHSTEIFLGPIVLIFRFLLKSNVQKMFKASVEGLIKTAEREHHGNAGNA